MKPAEEDAFQAYAGARLPVLLRTGYLPCGDWHGRRRRRHRDRRPAGAARAAGRAAAPAAGRAGAPLLPGPVGGRDRRRPRHQPRRGPPAQLPRDPRAAGPAGRHRRRGGGDVMTRYTSVQELLERAAGTEIPVAVDLAAVTARGRTRVRHRRVATTAAALAVLAAAGVATATLRGSDHPRPARPTPTVAPRSPEYGWTSTPSSRALAAELARLS